MKAAQKCLMIVSLLLVMLQSVASAQLIPRRNVTRPCPINKIPMYDYQTMGRSQSVTAVSYRFVYMDDLANIATAASINKANSLSAAEPAKTAKAKEGAIPTVAKVLKRSVLDAAKIKTMPKPPPSAANQIKRPEEKGLRGIRNSAANETVAEDKSAEEMVTVVRDKKLYQWRNSKLQVDHCQISDMALQLSRNGDWILSLRADQNRVGSISPNRFNPTLHIKRNQFVIVLRCYGNLAAPAMSGAIIGKPVLVALKVEEWVENGVPSFIRRSENEPAISEHFDLIDRVEIEFYYHK